MIIVHNISNFYHIGVLTVVLNLGFEKDIAQLYPTGHFRCVEHLQKAFSSSRHTSLQCHDTSLICF